ncbi:glucose-6-phosphate dehydrogenase [Radiomyces spectabilis]|uniref:glucose-6-phosphate dehydrogenase n=1 Tax=Radiomyces spectabilis TaxID=64574 RepID=UPI002220B26A|nr:glucose-6-phosphate dehydrogenase [Radiomyces spectabilis]KAI8370421.1 glucose-6-phosphate dehydrogenase [Radiomyces spectabilis]
MLRASRLCNARLVRSALTVDNRRMGLSMIKRCESTATNTTSNEKKGGSVLGTLLGVTVVAAAGYGGAVYYALHDDDFHDMFVKYVPGSEPVLNYLEDMHKNEDLLNYREQVNSLKSQAEEYTNKAKDYGNKAKETANDVFEYANDTYLKLTGQREPPKLATKKTPVEVVAAAEKSPATVVNNTAQLTLTSDNKEEPTVLAVAVEKPEPIVVKYIPSDHAAVDELSRVVVELASILNDAGLAGVGRDTLKDAEDQVQKLDKAFSSMDAEHSNIKKSIQQLDKRTDQLSNGIDTMRKHAKDIIQQSLIDSSNRIAAQEAEMKKKHEQDRLEMKKSFAQVLAAELNAQQERMEHERAEALIEQAAELQRRFIREVKYLVEQERAGRLSKLEHISARFKALEQHATQNAVQLDQSRKIHLMHVALNALHEAVDAQHKQPFIDELRALHSSSGDDNVVLGTVLKTIPHEVAEQGVESIKGLATRFETVATQVRRVALVPEDGGFGSHILSMIMSKLLFKKQGLVQGDDTEATLARTGYYLKINDLESATRELNQLKGWPKRLARDWIQAARRHLEVKQALEMPSAAVTKLQEDVHNEMQGAATIIVLGASGDLARKKTFPTLYNLFSRGFLPKQCQIVGYARTKMERDEFVKRASEHLKDTEGDKKKEFMDITTYFSGAYDKDDAWKSFGDYVAELESKRSLKKGQKNRIFYMALPPSVFLPVATGLRKFLWTDEGHCRIVVEKPFGKDLESCDKLLEDMAKLFKEDEIFRIDHYLGKEMAKDIMTLRFANVLFSPVWNQQYIHSVQITLKEPFGTEGRGGYFDEYGIIRDVMENHLLQLLSLVAMERPIRRDAESIRDEKVKVLKCIKPIELDDTLLGQYVSNGDKPGYLDDDSVPKGSLCPTFAAMVLWIDNERWDKVPFIVKAGKAMDNAKVDIRVQFRKLPGSFYKDVARNELVIRVQPNEAIYMKFNNKTPGLSYDTLITELDLTYKSRYTNMTIPDAYDGLILDVMRGDHSNFVRDDELDAAWRIFTPVLHRIEREHVKPEPYKYGTRGPNSLNDFVKRYGVEHLAHENYQWPKQNVDG